MLRTRTLTYLLCLGLSTAGVTLIADQAAPAVAHAKGTKKAPKKKAPKPKPAPKLSAENKKAREELMGPFKFGMSKDEVIQTMSKQLDEKYAEIIAETADVYTQDKLRKEKKKELKRIKQSFQAFEGKKTGWDVSVIDDQFEHGTDESMLVFWENQGGKNQRRFFFFHEDALYKMFITLDVTQFGDDQRDFSFFAELANGRFGPGTADDKPVTYDGVPSVHALDRVAQYKVFGLEIFDAARAKRVAEVRAERVHEEKEDNAIINAVLEKDGGMGPDIDQGSNTVDSIIKDNKKKK
ncbi:MAG: hypothetical protein H6709_15915 [Kofleriaceae bacterium]|nr:hypothetical protein [Kofleriaceae bacterium]MCB9573565.1 hypothetical protein [Kofleriaceae bacterium]